MIINAAYKAARDRALAECAPLIRDGHDFTQSLALTALQMYGRVLSASLHPQVNTPSLAAGLPHFAASWARCWGRDVFISLRGLFLTTGLFDAAREHILAFCSTLKHGLIPNLLEYVHSACSSILLTCLCSSIRSPRYNSRDSPWWMMQNIQDYVKMAPEGDAILDVPVKRRFPLNDEWVKWNDRQAYAYSSTVAEIIQEVLQRHAAGIHFREYNAGPNLDMQMSDEGFNIDIDVDWSTGLILGGNARNCGTWMDKMGESAKTGNKGFPGTPRDGAPVEITGLLKSTLTWVDSLVEKGRFPFKGVEATGSLKLQLPTTITDMAFCSQSTAAESLSLTKSGLAFCRPASRSATTFPRTPMTIPNTTSTARWYRVVAFTRTYTEHRRTENTLTINCDPISQ